MLDELSYKGTWHFLPEELSRIDEALEKARSELTVAEHEQAKNEILESRKRCRQATALSDEELEQEIAEKINSRSWINPHRDRTRVVLNFSDSSLLEYVNFSEAQSDTDAATRVTEGFTAEVERGQFAFRFRVSKRSSIDHATIEAGPGSLAAARSFREACKRSLQASRVPMWQNWIRSSQPLLPAVLTAGLMLCVGWYSTNSNYPQRVASAEVGKQVASIVSDGIDPREERKALELFLRSEFGIYEESMTPPLEPWKKTYPVVAEVCILVLLACLYFLTPRTIVYMGKGEELLMKDDLASAIAKWVAITAVFAGVVLPLGRQLLF